MCVHKEPTMIIVGTTVLGAASSIAEYAHRTLAQYALQGFISIKTNVNLTVLRALIWWMPISTLSAGHALMDAHLAQLITHAILVKLHILSSMAGAILRTNAKLHNTLIKVLHHANPVCLIANSVLESNRVPSASVGTTTMRTLKLV